MSRPEEGVTPRPWLRALTLAWLATLLSFQVLLAQGFPPLPDSTGWGVHVLAVSRDPAGGLWVGTYGQGIFRLRPGGTGWERIRHDTTATSISWDFVHALAFGSRGEIWYGTVGNGWGLSRDSGATWTNWTFTQLGPEWQYVAPDGIVGARRHDLGRDCRRHPDDGRQRRPLGGAGGHDGPARPRAGRLRHRRAR